MPRIMLLPVISVYADGTTDAKDVVSASLDDTVIRNASESLVMNTFLLEICGVIMIATDHHNPITCFTQPRGIAIVYIVIVSRLIEPKSAVPSNNKHGIRHLILIAQLIYHGVEIAVNIAANNYAFGFWKGVCAKRSHCVSG